MELYTLPLRKEQKLQNKKSTSECLFSIVLYLITRVKTLKINDILLYCTNLAAQNC